MDHEPDTGSTPEQSVGPAQPGVPDLAAITRWRRSLAAGWDPGPPPVPLPGLLRLERARRFARDLERSEGIAEPSPYPPLLVPLAAMLAARPAAPGASLRGLPAPAAAASPGQQSPGTALPVIRCTGPVLGFRAWYVAQDRLRGMRVSWPTATVMARCLTFGGPPGADASGVPHTDGCCGPPACGIYATKTAAAAAAAMEALEVRAPKAVGVVALSGKVVEHEHGFRAEVAAALAMLVVVPGELLRFDGIEVDELFLAPDRAIAAARYRARGLPGPGPECRAVLARELEAMQAGFCDGASGG